MFCRNEDVLVKPMSERLAYLNSTSRITEVELATPIVLTHVKLYLEVPIIQDRTRNLIIGISDYRVNGSLVQGPICEIDSRWRGLKCCELCGLVCEDPVV
jgi:hypothetical protein